MHIKGINFPKLWVIGRPPWSPIPTTLPTIASNIVEWLE